MNFRFTTIAGLLCLPWAVAAAPDCAALARLKLPQARIHTASPVAAGDRIALWSGGEPQAMPKPFCRVR
ncbi:MAG: hypothetical protein CFE32_21380, partial [Alphaproteobacteria bacterium PA3]